MGNQQLGRNSNAMEMMPGNSVLAHPWGCNTGQMSQRLFSYLQPRYPHVAFTYANLPWSDPRHTNIAEFMDHFNKIWVDNTKSMIGIAVGTDAPPDGSSTGHWQSIVVDKNSKTLEHLDSNVFRPIDAHQAPELNVLWELIREVTNTKNYKVLWVSGNEPESQIGPMCGTYAVKFLEMRAQGVPYRKAVSELLDSARWPELVQYYENNLARYKAPHKRKRKRQSRVRASRRR